MTKSSGIRSTLLVGGYNLGADIGSVSRIGCPVGVQDVTGLPSSARETALLIRDGMIDFAPFFNPATDRAHSVLSVLPTTDVQVMFLHRDTQGAAAACLVAKQVNYDGTRAASGELTFATNTTGNSYGLEWGTVLTDDGITTSGAAENLGSYDFGAASSFGFQAYMQVLAFTGTSATVTIQQSSDNGSGDAFAAVTGGAFTAASAIGAQRIATANDLAVERYLRVAISGTYSNLEFVVVVNRNATASVIF